MWQTKRQIVVVETPELDSVLLVPSHEFVLLSLFNSPAIRNVER